MMVGMVISKISSATVVSRAVVLELSQGPDSEQWNCSAEDRQIEFFCEGANNHIATVSKAILDRLPVYGKSITGFSPERAQIFFAEAQRAGYRWGRPE